MLISGLRRRLANRFRIFQFRRLAAGEPIAFTAGQMYGLPSVEGMIFVALAFVMLLTSATYSNNLMFATSFLAGSLFLVLPSFVYRNMSGCRYEFSDISPIFLEEKAQCQLLIHNQRTAWGLHILVDGGDSTFVEQVAQSTSVNLSFTPKQRGYNPFPPVRVSSAYPMKLFNLWGWMDNPHQVLVYPKPAGQPLESFFKLNNEKMAFDADLDLQYWQHRAFQPGDNYSRVDWAKLATTKKMYVREYRPTGDASLHFDLERTQMNCTDLEARLSQLSLWILQAQTRGLRYDLTIGGERLATERGTGHMHDCLTALACYQPPS